MQELLELILKNITTFPDEVSIEQAMEDGREVYTLKVHPDDMGRVIGKNGKVIQSIRSLAHVMGIRQNKHFRINLADVNPPQPTTETPVEEEDLISGAIDMDHVQEEEKTAKTKKT